MKRTRLVFAPADPQGAPTYRLIDAFGDVVGGGEQPVTTAAADPTTVTVLVVPGVDAVARWLPLPTRSDAQARAAAALILTDETALSDEPAHVAVGPLEDDGCRLVVAVAESRMRAWLDFARTYSLVVDRIAPDYLLLEADDAEALVAARIDDLVAVRGRRLALTCEPELLPALFDPPPAVVAGEAADRLLARGAMRPGLDLRQGPFAPPDTARPERRELLRAAVLGGLLLLSPILLNATQALRLNLAAERLERDAAARAAGLLPKGAAISDPAAQTAAVLQRAELGAGGGPAGLVAQLFQALAGIDQAQAENVMVSPDGALRATISHTNYSDVERLTAALGRQGVIAREEATREADGRIVTDIMMGSRR